MIGGVTRRCIYPRGAKKDVLDRRGRTALDLARAQQFQGMVELLIQWKPRRRPPRPVQVPSAVKKRSWKPVKVQLEAAKKIGQPVFLTNSIGMKFVLIPAGSFMMGSPPGELKRDDNEDQHQVIISRPFYLQTSPPIWLTSIRYESVAKRLIKVATATRDMDVPANREGLLTVAI